MKRAHALWLCALAACGKVATADEPPEESPVVDAGSDEPAEIEASSPEDAAAEVEAAPDACVPQIAHVVWAHACSHTRKGPYDTEVASDDPALGPEVNRVHVAYKIILSEDADADGDDPDAAPRSDADEPEGIPFVREQQQKRLASAERKLAQLGRVNPLALEEFAALEQRHKFLTEQLTDLTNTRKDLLTIIEEIDTKMQTIFESAFADTKEAFGRVFPILFPGGTGSIELTNPEDLLTTGIEVSVKPAGKKFERLSLLSGGERSLAAVALLIAIFKARPSPFYIMDEVEAALDDANLGRLLTIFEDLRESSQLIVITHQKRTMEIADALYGVSMRQDGVSAVVGQRVAQEKAS